MSPTKYIRLASVALALILIAALYTIGNQFGWNGMTQRPLAALVTVVCLLMLLISLFMLFQPPAKTERIYEWILHLGKPAVQEERSGKTVAKMILLVAAVGLIIMSTSYKAILTQDSHSDPAAFLRFAEDVQQNGGPLQLISDLYSGNYVQANQHPFYIGLLSISPDLDSGKWMSFIAAVITFLLIVTYLIRMHSWQAAAIAATLLATNHTFCYFSALATCEAWLTLFISLAWIATNQAVKSKTMKQALPYWLGAGLAMGLAYFTKGTALLFFGALILSALTFEITNQQHFSRIQKARAAAATVAVVIGGWLITAHPLLIRNTLVYDSPTFNVNSYFLYMDEFPDTPEIQAKLAASDSLAEVRRDFFREHAITELLHREFEGIGWETLIFTRSFGPSPLGESRIFFGIPVLLLLLLALFHLNRTMQVFVTTLIISSIIIFAWYIPIAAGERFTAPLLPLVMAYAGISLQNMVSNQAKPRSTVILMACLGWIILWTGWAATVLSAG